MKVAKTLNIKIELTDDDIKEIIKDHLEHAGYIITNKDITFNINKVQINI